VHGMKRVVIFNYAEMGHLLPTYLFARKLKERGFEVIYACSEEKLFPSMNNQGFAAVAYQDQDVYIAAHQGASIYELLKGRKDMMATFMQEQKPDLIICDCIDQYIVGIAVEHQIPVCTYAPGLPDRHDWMLVPMTRLFEFLPKWHHPIYTSICRVLWLLIRQLEIHFHPLWKNYHKLIRESLRSANIPISRVDWKGGGRERFRGVPEVVLCPQCFDYPRTNTEDMLYDGPSIELSRVNPDAVIPRDPKKKLVYCSFGSQTNRYQNGRQIFCHIIEAFMNKPEWELIIAVGKDLEADLSSLYKADNIRITGFAPQLDILRVADLAIIHGGLGGIKECIYFGVPMIILPFDTDQFGNAWLVETHSIGVQYPIQKITPTIIQSMVAKILDTPMYRANVKNMSDIFQAAQQKSVMADLVTEMLRQN